MRSKLELYKIVLEDFKEKGVFICNTIEMAKIKNNEVEMLLEHFQSQYPSETQYVDFYNHELFNKDNIMGTWFKYNFHFNEGKQLRINLLEAIIRKLE